MSKYLFLSLLSFFLAFLLTPLVRRAALGIGLGFQIHGLPLLGYPISSQILSISLTLLWILLITNAFNLIDGLDGLSGGLAFIAGLTLLALSLVRGDVQTALLATVLCGAVAGFLKYNFHPASIFMGDSGSLFLGYVLSLVALRSSAKGVAAVVILAPLLALGLPLFDTLLAAKLLPFYALGIYRRSWPHSNIADMIGLGKALLIGSLLFALPAMVMLSSSPPASVLVIDFLLFSFLTAVARTSFRWLEYVKFKGEERERRVLSLKGRGAGVARGQRGRGVEVQFLLRPSAPLPLRSKVEAHGIDTVLISSPEIPPGRVAWLQEVLEATGVELQRCRIVLETVTGNGKVKSGGTEEPGGKGAGE